MMKAHVIALRLLSHVVVPAAAALAVSTSTVACADENDPQTWVKRLDDQATRAPAITRLGQFFNDAMSAANNNREDPKVKSVVDAAAGPLAKTYTAGGLDDKTRVALIKLLADMGDPRAAPAFVKVFKDFESGKTDEDLTAASQGTTRIATAGKLTDQSLVDALWDCFAKFKLSANTKSVALKDSLKGAVKAAKPATYGAKAVELLSKPVNKPDDPSESMDFQFWQVTAAQIVGDLKYTGAVKQLVTVLMTPSKRQIVLPVRLALQRMPKEAEPVLIQALKGTGDFSELAKAYADKAYVPAIAEVLAYISRPPGLAAVTEQLAAADNDSNRTMLASYLTFWPTTPATTKAFTDAAAKLSPNATAAALGGGNSHAYLAGNSAQFFDSSMTEWTLKEVNSAKGEGTAEAVQAAGVISAIKTMTPEKAKAVTDTINDKMKGPATEKDMNKAAVAVLDKCKKDVGCYVAILDTPVPSSPPAAKMGHVKAVWMIAMSGDASVKGKLFDKIGSIKDRSIRLPLCEALDHLSPQGDQALGDKLEKLAETEIAANNKDGTDEMVRIALKLRSRVP